MMIMTMIIDKNNKKNAFNNQFVFIFVNYNILLEAPGSERKAIGLEKYPQYVIKVIKIGFQNIRVGAHARTQVQLSVTTPQRNTREEIKLHSFFGAAL
jgi:hypothetical protein